MNKCLFVLSLVINLFYMATALTDFGLSLSPVTNITFGVVFVISMLGSILYLVQVKQKSGSSPFLSIAVLTLSVASLGWYSFINYFSLLMGG